MNLRTDNKQHTRRVKTRKSVVVLLAWRGLVPVPAADGGVLHALSSHAVLHSPAGDADAHQLNQAADDGDLVLQGRHTGAWGACVGAWQVYQA